MLDRRRQGCGGSAQQTFCSIHSTQAVSGAHAEPLCALYTWLTEADAGASFFASASSDSLYEGSERNVRLRVCVPFDDSVHSLGLAT